LLEVSGNSEAFKGEDQPESGLKIQSVPRSKHCLSVTKASQLMLYREIIAVCSEIHTKQINTVCGLNVELLSVKPGGTYSNHSIREMRTSGFVSKYILSIVCY
jgi:hypothetical protein